MISVDPSARDSINTTGMNSINTPTPNSLRNAQNQPHTNKQAQNMTETPFSLSTGSLFTKEKVQWCGHRDLNPGRRLGKPFLIDWLGCSRQGFMDYLTVQEYDELTIKDMLRYLDKYAPVLEDPLDVITLFSHVPASKRHLVLGLRVLFNFYEVLGCSKEYLDALRNALPRIQCGIDLKIPTENEVLQSLEKLLRAPIKYRTLFSLLLDSGLRLVEGVELINNFKSAEAVNGFCRCEVAMFRGEKQAYYGHFTEATLELINQVTEKLERTNASHYYQKFKFVRPKYLRKFAFDKMIELEVPESVADFIEGRVPTRIGAKHYMALARQASKFYPRYAKYVTNLRQKALN
jgi:intergrase/recombinase